MSWCDKCQSEVATTAGEYCAECGSDLLFGWPRENIKIVCCVCKAEDAEPEQDVCFGCYDAIVSNLSQSEIETKFPDLCPMCVSVKIAQSQKLCATCQEDEDYVMSQGTGTVGFGRTVSGFGSEDYEDDYDWTGWGWGASRKPILPIPNAEDEVETIPAIRVPA